MTKQEIYDGLVEVIKTIKPKADLSKAGMDSSLSMDLGIDSLSMLLMSLAIEGKFGFQFDTQTTFNKVGEVIDYIAEKLG